MNLDIELLTADWPCPPDEVCARVVTGYDGAELIQLRVDLGVLQMFPDGRPDGCTYRGYASALERIEREQRARRRPTDDDWQELQRELAQLNYRRLALYALSEAALKAGDADRARRGLERCVRDIDQCARMLELLESLDDARSIHPGMRPTLVFSRTRVLARLHILEGRVDDAIEVVEAGIRAIDELLGRAGLDEDVRQQDGSIAFLREMEARLREEHGVAKTLRERLDDAIEREDFEAAARLRDELRKRRDGERDGGGSAAD